MEEEAEGVRDNQSREPGAVVPSRDNRKNRTAESADQPQEREEVAVLEERLQQHDEDAEAAPDKLGQDKLHISEGGHAGVHLAGAGPFERDFDAGVFGASRSFLGRDVAGANHLLLNVVGSSGSAAREISGADTHPERNNGHG